MTVVFWGLALCTLSNLVAYSQESVVQRNLRAQAVYMVPVGAPGPPSPGKFAQARAPAPVNPRVFAPARAPASVSRGNPVSARGPGPVFPGNAAPVRAPGPVNAGNQIPVRPRASASASAPPPAQTPRSDGNMNSGGAPEDVSSNEAKSVVRGRDDQIPNNLNTNVDANRATTDNEAAENNPTGNPDVDSISRNTDGSVNPTVGLESTSATPKPTQTPKPTEAAKPTETPETPELLEIAKSTETPKPAETPRPTETPAPTQSTPTQTVPPAPIESPKPTETLKPSQTQPPTETPRLTATPKPIETTHQTETPKPSVTLKTTESPKLAETPKPTSTSTQKPTETPKPTKTTTPTQTTAPQDSKWPTGQETVSFKSAKVIETGQVFDGRMKRYERSGGACDANGDSKSDDAMFVVKPGGTLKNAIIAGSSGVSVWCAENNCNLDKVFFEGACQAAVMIAQGQGTTKINGGGARNTKSRVVLHKGSGDVTVSHFMIESTDELVESCGTCGPVKRQFTLSNIDATKPRAAIARVNKNYHDEAKLSNVVVKGVSSSFAFCAKYEGGKTPKKVGEGKEDKVCAYGNDVRVG